MSGFSALTEAYTTSLIQGLDPMNKVVQNLAAQQLKAQDVDLDMTKLAMVDEIQGRINALGDNPDASVLDCYRKMLKKYYA